MSKLGDAPGGMPAALPQFAATGALLLRLDPATMRPPSVQRVRLDGRWLRRKREFHVTVLGRSLGPRLRGLFDEPALQVTLAGLDWRVERQHRYDLLGRMKPSAHGAVACYSVIEHLRVPGMTALYALLGEQVPDFPPCPPPHATHYVLGDRDGIGIPSEEALAAYRVRGVQEAELA
jgi:hypothetical protein